MRTILLLLTFIMTLFCGQSRGRRDVNHSWPNFGYDDQWSSWKI